MNTFFNKGDRVTIYQDPVTEQNVEGLARLICFNSSYYDIERWTVQFAGESRHVERSISTSGKNKRPQP